MFGFGRTKFEKMALKVERVERARELAYEKGQMGTVVEGQKYREKVFSEVEKWLEENPKYSENDFEQYLIDRGKIRSLIDEEYDTQMEVDLQMYKARNNLI